MLTIMKETVLLLPVYTHSKRYNLYKLCQSKAKVVIRVLYAAFAL
jgi:hypothetical protein